ncbi:MULTISPECIES: glycosyltransferase family 9 protein [Vibrio]|uniref:glycosyltransferase family 9 protein n=1 Tax=Vibrio TaxID=662 RepID=UPI000310EAF2|nr:MULTISPECIES: glycosyltransferase family 9 protein [Vibrio]OEE97341.1 ADP-heptose--LPS heptosyltransferase [Vibrio crassostreae 9ZC77]PMK10972.1 ADP-heptose--LPS heptosyltransferase [Vibrio sp. 10N.261.54.E10]
MQKILVVRNDKIGDFMLAWPSFAMLKVSLPNTHITALVPKYTVALAELCPWIDSVLLDPTENSSKEEQKKLLEKIKTEKFDVSINFFSTAYNAKLVWKAKIPYRLAPATKFTQILYNKRIVQRRSKSLKSEYEYNLDLVRSFLDDINKPIVEPSTPYLTFSESELITQKNKLAEILELDKNRSWLFVHAGTGGSANNLSLNQYRDLIAGLAAKFEIVLTAGPGEEGKAQELKNLLAKIDVEARVYDKNDGLVDFSRSLACADLFTAGSTGPLHIAAALDVPTIGFFPSKRSATPLRWRPLNSVDTHIAFCPQNASSRGEQDDLTRIDISYVLETIEPWISNLKSSVKGM